MHQKQLKDCQGKAFFKMVEAVPSTRLEEIVIDYKKHHTGYHRDAGLVMFPSDNPRYEKFCSLMRG